MLSVLKQHLVAVLGYVILRLVQLLQACFAGTVFFKHAVIGIRQLLLSILNATCL